MYVDFPFHYSPDARLAVTDDDDHLRDMLEQLLLTSPGERVNRPDFGCGLLRQVFEPNSPELAAALAFTIQASIHRWLGDVVEARDVRVESDEGVLRVSVGYLVRRTAELRAEIFEWSTP